MKNISSEYLKQLKEELKNEFQSFKSELSADSREFKDFADENLNSNERIYFNNELNRSLSGTLDFDVTGLTKAEIKAIIKIIKEVLNELGYSYFVINLNKKEKTLTIIVEF